MPDMNNSRRSIAYWDEKISTILKTQRADHTVQYIMDCYRLTAGEDQFCFVAALAGCLVIEIKRSHQHGETSC